MQPGDQRHCVLYAHPRWLSYRQRIDWDAYARRLFPYSSGCRNLRRRWGNASYLAL